MKKAFQFLLVLFVVSATAQSTDLARIEYTYFPQSSSDNSFRRFRSLLNFPIKLNDKEHYLIPGLDYENVNFKLEDNVPVSNVADLDRYQSFTLSLGYLFPWKDNWLIGAQGGAEITSNFENGNVTWDDLIYTGAVFFIKSSEEDLEEPWRLILGIHYSTTSGFPFPLPVVNYNKRLKNNWSYILGVPKSNIKYFFNEKNVVQSFITLDGFFANIQNNRQIANTNDVAANISMTIVLAGVGYEYNFTKNLAYYLYTGHTVINDIRFRDESRNTIYDINRTNSFYGRTGIKFQF